MTAANEEQMKVDRINISIRKEQLSQLPTVNYSGYITVVDSLEKASSAISHLNKQQIVGFDTETKPSFRKGRVNKVSLVQIATERNSFLFRINKIGFCSELIGFMENPSIVKVGLSLRDDFHVLHRLAEFTPQGFIELQTLVKEYCISDNSLQKIYGILFNERISKGQRLSNWEAERLTPSQQQYASIDAWSCLRIYRHLKSGLFVPEYSEYILPEEETDEITE